MYEGSTKWEWLSQSILLHTWGMDSSFLNLRDLGFLLHYHPKSSYLFLLSWTHSFFTRNLCCCSLDINNSIQLVLLHPEALASALTKDSLAS